MKKAIVSLLFNSTTLVVAVLIFVFTLSSGVVSAENFLSIADGLIGGVRNEVSSLKRLNGNILIGAGAVTLILVVVTLIIDRQGKEKTKSVQKIN